MKHILLLLILLTTSFSVKAQEVVLITKEEVVAKVKENNNSIKMSQQDVLVAKGDFNQTNAVLLPNISVSHTGMTTTNPLMAFGFKLNQEILTQGDFDPALLNDPRQIEDYTTKIEFQQPLVNLDGIFQRKAAKAKLNATELQSERTKDYIDLEVEKAYMQLQLAYKTVDVLETAKKVGCLGGRGPRYRNRQSIAICQKQHPQRLKLSIGFNERHFIPNSKAKGFLNHCSKRRFFKRFARKQKRHSSNTIRNRSL